MKAITNEWIRKAEGDLLTAQREMKATPANYDAMCFHAQQCAQEYIKARLVEEGMEFPKTHDLECLVEPSFAYRTWLGFLAGESGPTDCLGR